MGVADADRPDKCDGTWEEFCDKNREYSNLTALLTEGAPCTLKYMETFWKDYSGDDESFWEHEFNKHGTCMSTLKPSCYPDYYPGQEAVDYFKKTVSLFKALPSYKWLVEAGIVPSATVTYTRAQIQEALTAHHGHNVIINCNRNKELNELWYHYNVQGSVQTGTFVPVDPFGSSTCPQTGIKYLPKNDGGNTETSTSTTTTSSSTYSSEPPTLTTVVSSTISEDVSSVTSSAASSATSSESISTSTSTETAPTSVPSPLSGRGRFYAAAPQSGFLITAGTWYRAGGTPATYTATPNTDGTFQLNTSRGRCTIETDSSLFCDASVPASRSASFGFDGTYLTYAGSSSFYAAQVPTGTTQGKLFTEPNAVTIQFTWTAL